MKRAGDSGSPSFDAVKPMQGGRERVRRATPSVGGNPLELTEAAEGGRAECAAVRGREREERSWPLTRRMWRRPENCVPFRTPLEGAIPYM